MKTFRNLRVANLIEHELTKIFQKELGFTDTLVTIIEVFVSDDLLHAIVKIGIIPYEKELEVFYEVDKRKGELEHKLFKKINIRPMPHLKFEIDSKKENMA